MSSKNPKFILILITLKIFFISPNSFNQTDFYPLYWLLANMN